MADGSYLPKTRRVFLGWLLVVRGAETYLSVSSALAKGEYGAKMPKTPKDTLIEDKKEPLEKANTVDPRVLIVEACGPLSEKVGRTWACIITWIALRSLRPANSKVTIGLSMLSGGSVAAAAKYVF